MKSRRLGKTSIEVSSLAFGGGNAAGLLVNGTEEAQRVALAAALEAGINYFDTAPLYGNGQSERNLGVLLKLFPSTEVHIATKVALSLQDRNCGNLASTVVRSVEGSLARLGQDYVDVVFLHNGVQPLSPRPITAIEARNNYMPDITLSQMIEIDGVLQAADALKSSGKVGYFGLAGPDSDPIAVQDLVATGTIDVINQVFNLVNPSAVVVGDDSSCPPRWIGGSFGDLIDHSRVAEFSQIHGAGVCGIAPLAAGCLTEQALDGEPPPAVSDRSVRFTRAGSYERTMAVARQFRSLANDVGIPLPELATRFAMSFDCFATVVGGFSDVGQLTDAVHWVNRGPLEDDVLALVIGEYAAGSSRRARVDAAANPYSGNV